MKSRESSLPDCRVIGAVLDAMADPREATSHSPAQPEAVSMDAVRHAFLCGATFAKAVAV